MARGLKLPIQVGADGRTATIEGDEQASKIISLALSDGDNQNAFQQELALGSDMIFNIRVPAFRARVLSRLFKIFSDFEKNKLFKLNKGSIKWSSSVEGEAELSFLYVNLESDQVLTFNKTFSGKGGL